MSRDEVVGHVGGARVAEIVWKTDDAGCGLMFGFFTLVQSVFRGERGRRFPTPASGTGGLVRF